jgi:hypothetical protein
MVLKFKDSELVNIREIPNNLEHFLANYIRKSKSNEFSSQESVKILPSDGEIWSFFNFLKSLEI